MADIAGNDRISVRVRYRLPHREHLEFAVAQRLAKYQGQVLNQADLSRMRDELAEVLAAAIKREVTVQVVKIGESPDEQKETP